MSTGPSQQAGPFANLIGDETQPTPAETARLTAADDLAGVAEGLVDNDDAPPLLAVQRGGPSGRPLASLGQRLMAAADNERYAPEILPYPEGLLSGTLALIDRQQTKIRELEEQRAQRREAGADPQTGERNPASADALPFRPEDLYRIEVVRLRYVCTEILRLRLQKIHRQARRIVARPAEFADTLTDNERLVAQRIFQLQQTAFQAGGLSLLPSELNATLPVPITGNVDVDVDHATPQAASSSSGGGGGFAAEGEECLPQVDTSRYVFVTPLEPMSLTLPDIDQPRELRQGDIWICRYAHIKEHVLAARMRLL